MVFKCVLTFIGICSSSRLLSVNTNLRTGGEFWKRCDAFHGFTVGDGQVVGGAFLLRQGIQTPVFAFVAPAAAVFTARRAAVIIFLDDGQHSFHGQQPSDQRARAHRVLLTVDLRSALFSSTAVVPSSSVAVIRQNTFGVVFA